MEPRDRGPSGSPGLTKTCPGAPGRAGRFPGASGMLPRSVQGVSWTLPHAAQFDFRFQDASGRPNFASRRLQDARKCIRTPPRRSNNVFFEIFGSKKKANWTSKYNENRSWS